MKLNGNKNICMYKIFIFVARCIFVFKKRVVVKLITMHIWQTNYFMPMVCSFVRFLLCTPLAILPSWWIKVVRTRQPWSDLYLLPECLFYSRIQRNIESIVCDRFHLPYMNRTWLLPLAFSRRGLINTITFVLCVGWDVTRKNIFNHGMVLEPFQLFSWEMRQLIKQH